MREYGKGNNRERKIRVYGIGNDQGNDKGIGKG